MKKKKVLLALLASICVAASASAFAACSDKGGNGGPDPALYAAYETYASSTDDPMSYEDWVKGIVNQLLSDSNSGPAGDPGADGVGVEDVEIVEDESGNKYFRFKFSDGSHKDVPVEEVA